VTNPEWWASCKKPIVPREPPRRLSGRVWTLHRDRHEATLDLRLVEHYGAEILLTVNGELKRARFYWRTQVLAMLDAIIATEAKLANRGWTKETQQ